MDEALRSVSEHMRALGLGALAHANWHANYHSMENEHWSELSVLQAAHAAEILIKARIAQEHPLLIFEQLPKASESGPRLLKLEELIENGRTYQYADLPNMLWATTGLQVPDLPRYRSYGRLRNAIQHFTAPSREASQDAIEFIYSVIDPFINHCWGEFAIDYNEDHETYTYLVAGLVRRGVLFLVSPGVLEALEHIEFEWPTKKPSYREEMENRIAQAKKTAEMK